MPQPRILLGVIGRPHGVRGLVHVTSHTADPAALAAYGTLTDDRGRRFTLRWRGEGLAEVTEHRDGEAVNVADRTAAEKLVNTRLYIERAQLPAPQDDEYYLADLIGMIAVGPDGAVLGKVETVHDYGAGASLEIERDGAPPLLVPFTRACVPDVDLASNRITIDPPDEATNLTDEAGLSREADHGAERGGEGEGEGEQRAPHRSGDADQPSPHNADAADQPSPLNADAADRPVPHQPKARQPERADPRRRRAATAPASRATSVSP